MKGVFKTSADYASVSVSICLILGTVSDYNCGPFRTVPWCFFTSLEISAAINHAVPASLLAKPDPFDLREVHVNSETSSVKLKEATPKTAASLSTPRWTSHLILLMHTSGFLQSPVLICCTCLRS